MVDVAYEYSNPLECAEMITVEQAEEAKSIIRETLDVHNRQSVPFVQIWTKPREDFDGVAFLKVWLVYEGKHSDLDVGVLNSYDRHLFKALREAGIDALPSVSYIPITDVERNHTPWTQ